jgi:predicted nucleic acid-binding protein
MKILIDTNIALDVLLKREPFYEDAAKVILLSEKDIIDAYVSASAVTDIYYIARKH